MGIPYAEVIGDPIAHSKSPLIHKFWLKSLGIEGDYRSTRVTAGELSSFLAARRDDPDWRGCNVTMPHKLGVAEFMDHVDPSARRIGAINTIVNREGLLSGTNTDWQGLNLALGDYSASGKDTVLIGAGGAARAALEELRQAGPRSLAMLNRDTAKATRLMEEFGFSGPAMPLGAAPEADLLINASPLGMAGYPPLDIDLSRLRSGGAVVDMVYHPVETALLRNARSRGLIAVDGLEMLVWQASMAFQYFFRTGPEQADSNALRELLTR
ncbi:MAG TPA: shikimate dehydrogenase [Allosphingosinicella sp.]|nr:shikimate dehydrogenase [Allosphingosinicella sp.]